MDEFQSAGVEVTFGYFKRSFIPAGVILDQHSHKHDHLSVLAQGRVTVEVDGRVVHYVAPAEILIKSGEVHRVTAHTDVIWYCNHDINTIPHELIDKSLIL